MRYSGILILLFALYVLPVNGQDETGGSVDEGDLYLNLRNINFVKNNEYSNPIIE
jgi:hypothetical protein